MLSSTKKECMPDEIMDFLEQNSFDKLEMKGGVTITLKDAKSQQLWSRLKILVISFFNSSDELLEKMQNQETLGEYLIEYLVFGTSIKLLSLYGMTSERVQEDFWKEVSKKSYDWLTIKDCNVTNLNTKTLEEIIQNADCISTDGSLVSKVLNCSTDKVALFAQKVNSDAELHTKILSPVTDQRLKHFAMILGAKDLKLCLNKNVNHTKIFEYLNQHFQETAISGNLWVEDEKLYETPINFASSICFADDQVLDSILCHLKNSQTIRDVSSSRHAITDVQYEKFKHDVENLQKNIDLKRVQFQCTKLSTEDEEAASYIKG